MQPATPRTPTATKTFSLHPGSLVAGGLMTLAGMFSAGGAQEAAPEVLRARALEIVNEAGEVVAVLDGSRLLIGGLDRERVLLEVSEGHAQVALQGLADGGGLKLEAGVPSFTSLQMTSPDNEVLVALGIASFSRGEPASGGLIVRRAGMQPSVMIKTDDHGGFVGLENRGGPVVTLAANAGGHGTLTTARTDGRNSGFLGATQQGLAAMELYAPDQTPILAMGERGGAATLSLSGDGTGRGTPLVTLIPRTGKPQYFPPNQR